MSAFVTFRALFRKEMKTKKERTKMNERVPLRKLGRLSNAYVAGRLPLHESMGGNVFHEGKLFMLPNMERDEIHNLSSSRSSRLIRDEDDYVIALQALETINRGHFYNVQEDEKKARFIRDDLVEPVDSSVDLLIYKHDILVRSRKFRDKTDFLVGGCFVDDDSVCSDEASNPEVLLEERSDSFVEEELETGPKKGSRAPIQQLTRKSSDKMKFTLRNSLCEFHGFMTLTYPRRYPRNGKTCKKHINAFLTHLRKDYKGIKYFWFMEFQARGAPHFHMFTSCLVPGKTYVSPLWYRIVNSRDPAHLKAGTNVIRMRSSKDVIRYATSYAKKITQKMTPEDFACVGRYWGCSRKLCDPTTVLSDVSIRQVQELWSFYYAEIGLPSHLRVDKFNGYVWNGHRFGARLAFNYFESHMRPLFAEMSMISRAKVKPGAKAVILSRDSLALMSGLRDMKKRVSAGCSVWKDLTEEEFDKKLKKGTVRLRNWTGRFEHSLASAYSEIDELSYLESSISLEEWADWLAYLQISLELNWAEHFQPLVKVLKHTHVTLCKDGRIYKRKYVASFADSEAPYNKIGKKEKKKTPIKRSINILALPVF